MSSLALCPDLKTDAIPNHAKAISLFDQVLLERIIKPNLEEDLFFTAQSETHAHVQNECRPTP